MYAFSPLFEHGMKQSQILGNGVKQLEIILSNKKQRCTTLSLRLIQ